MIETPARLRCWTMESLVLRMGLFATLGTLAIAAIPAQAQSRTTLVVAVADATTGAPIPDADVSIPSLSRQARTDWIGEARFSDLNQGTCEIRVRHVGFAAADIQVRLRADTVGITFMLEHAALALDTVHVREKAIVNRAHAEFDARRHMGLGRFLGPQELATERLRAFPLVAMAHFPGLMLVTSAGGQWQLASLHGSCGVDTTHEAVAKSRATGLALLAQQAQQVGGEGSGARERMSETANSPSTCFSAQPCHVKLFLDDLPVAETDINIVHTEELYGVEYYSVGNAPPRYRTSGAACGVMLLWSKGYGDG